MGKKKQSDKLALWLSIVALVVAVGSLFLSVWAYVQTDRPHTIFEESCAKLELLDNKIERAESYIQNWREEGSTPGTDLAVYEVNLAQARTLRDEAESSLMRYECKQANEYILQADDLASSVPAWPTPPAAGSNWGLIGGIIAAVLVGLFLLLLLIFDRRRKPSDPEKNTGSRLDSGSHTPDGPAK